MFLAFQLSDIITVPFGYLLGLLYQVTNSYGLSMILFAILVQIVLIPINAKSKKSMMKMSRLQPRIQEIQRKYANDQQKQQEAMQKLQQEEGASMGCGGCLWSLVPLLILFPLFSVIRSPIRYMLHESEAVVAEIIRVISGLSPESFSGSHYDQLIAAPLIPQFAAEIKAAIPNISELTLEGIDFTFLGLNLGVQPSINIFASTWAWDWAHIGAALIPVMSAASQLLSMWLSQKSNDSVITNEKGLQDEETAKKSQSAQSTKMMMWMSPLLSLWIGFSYPSALSLYWFVQGIASMIINQALTKKYRKLYDAEDAIKLQRAMELEAMEAEKERIRAEKRAANPDGITTNTSKKKLQNKQRAEEEAERAEAARDYALRKGIVTEEPVDENAPLSGDPQRPFAKGRAYDPNRYHSTEE